MHEFKAWQMEYGDAEIDWDHYDHHGMDMGMGKEDYGDYDKPVKPTGMPGKINHVYLHMYDSVWTILYELILNFNF